MKFNHQNQEYQTQFSSSKHYEHDLPMRLPSGDKVIVTKWNETDPPTPLKISPLPHSYDGISARADKVQ